MRKLTDRAALKGWSTALLAVIALAAPLTADTQDTAVKRSQDRARKILDAAVEAIGGRAAVDGVRVVRIKLAGESTPRLQNPNAQPPYAPASYQEEAVLDLAQNRLALTVTNKGGGFRASNRIVVTGNTGQNFDLLNRNVTPIAAAGAQNQLAVYQRRLPSLILRTALQRAATLRYLGEDTLGGAKHHVITFVHQDPVQMSLYVDAKTNLLTKYKMIYPDTVTGDDASELSFADYRKVGALMVPSTFGWKQAGEVTAKWTYDVAFDPQLTDTTFDVKTDGFRVQAAAAPRAVAVEKLGEGVYLVTNLGGGGYNVMAVEFGDHVVAIEAPLSSQVSEQAIAEIKKAIPNKPIKYLAITHHHGDHSGGLRAFVADGATVVTTPQNVAFVKSLVESKGLVDGLAKDAKSAEAGAARRQEAGLQRRLTDAGALRHRAESARPRVAGRLLTEAADPLPGGHVFRPVRRPAAWLRAGSDTALRRKSPRAWIQGRQAGRRARKSRDHDRAGRVAGTGETNPDRHCRRPAEMIGVTQRVGAAGDGG